MSEEKYHIVNPEQEVVCPYDKTHMIRAKRFPYHLMKCRQNHPGYDYGTCPFNARHEIRTPELRYHISNCPDRCRIDLDIIYENEKNHPQKTGLKGCTDVPAYNMVPLAPPTEDWDTEIPEGVDRYRHMPGVYKNKSRIVAQQQRLLQQYFIGQTKKKQPEPVMVHNSVRVKKALSNPIYAMTMAGVGRGKLDAKGILELGKLQTQLGRTASSQELMAALGRGRGSVISSSTSLHEEAVNFGSDKMTTMPTLVDTTNLIRQLGIQDEV